MPRWKRWRIEAQFVIEHAALGQPANRMGNLDGDEYSDLIFSHPVGENLEVTIVRGGPSGGETVEWPRLWNQDFVNQVLDGENSIQWLLPLEITPSEISVHALNYLGGSTHDDLLIMSSTPNDNDVFGYIFSGQTVTNNDDNDDNAAATIKAFFNAPALPLRQEDLKVAVVGDADGDEAGLDDLLLYDGRRDLAGLVVGGTTGTITLSASTSIGGDLILPAAVGDVNSDGLQDFALASARDVKVYFGTDPEAIDFGAQTLPSPHRPRILAHQRSR